MISETGKIVAITNTDGKKVAVVECTSRSACSGCHNQNSCGVGAVAKTMSDKTHQFSVPFKEGMEVGERLDLQIKNRDLVSSAVIAYLVPLLFFIGGALLVNQLTSVNEGVIITVAIACAAIGFLFTRLLSSKLFTRNTLISTKIER